MKKRIISGCLVAVSLALGSCATIIHGSRQDVSISSNPSSAKVYVDGQEYGRTPVNVSLHRNSHHQVKIELDGYLPYEARFTRKVDGWIAGNIVFGGIIGLAVDAATGSMYKLSPDQMPAELRSSNASLERVEKDLYLAVVLKADPSWQAIGQLQRSSTVINH